MNSLQKIVIACYYGQKLVINTLFEVTRTAGLPGVLINYYNGFKGIITVCFKQLINLKSVLGRNFYTVSTSQSDKVNKTAWDWWHDLLLPLNLSFKEGVRVTRLFKFYISLMFTQRSHNVARLHNLLLIVVFALFMIPGFYAGRYINLPL